MENSQKAELIVQALQERIGQLVAGYETQIAILRAELTTVVNQQQDKQNAMTDYSEELINKMEA